MSGGRSWRDSLSTHGNDMGWGGKKSQTHLLIEDWFWSKLPKRDPAVPKPAAGTEPQISRRGPEGTPSPSCPCPASPHPMSPPSPPRRCPMPGAGAAPLPPAAPPPARPAPGGAGADCGSGLIRGETPARPEEGTCKQLFCARLCLLVGLFPLLFSYPPPPPPEQTLRAVFIFLGICCFVA